MLRSGLASACVVRFRSMRWINENVPLHHRCVVNVAPRHPLLRFATEGNAVPYRATLYYQRLKTFTRTLYDHTRELQ